MGQGPKGTTQKAQSVQRYFPVATQGNISKMVQTKLKNNQCHSGAQTSDYPNSCKVPFLKTFSKPYAVFEAVIVLYYAVIVMYQLNSVQQEMKANTEFNVAVLLFTQEVTNFNLLKVYFSDKNLTKT